MTDYPFKGFSIIFLIANILLLAISCASYFLFVRKLPEDPEKFKMNWKYVLKTLGYFLFTCLAFNRFGFLIMSPAYIYLRNFYLTFPFYLSMLVPMLILVVRVLTIFEVINTRKMKIVCTSVCIALIVILYGAYIILGATNTSVISAISPALPLERMATMPIETIIHVVACLAMSIPALIIFIRNKEEA